MVERFNLLHLSDLHFADTSGLKDREAIIVNLMARFRGAANQDIAEALAFEVFSMRDTVDAVLITGDLAITGRAEDLALAKDYVGKPAVEGWLSKDQAPTLATGQLPVWLLPGNHDRYHDSLGTPGCKEFDSMFADYWDVGQGVKSFEIDSGRGRLDVVCGDLSLQDSKDSTSRRGRWGQGRAYKALIRAMVERSSAIKAENTGRSHCGIIWAVHFPPHYPGGDESLQLINGKDLIEAAGEVGIEYILCGHQHRAVKVRLDDSLKVKEILCAGSATELKMGQENWFHLCNIEVGHSGEVEVRSKDFLWDRKSAGFYPFG